MDMDPPAPQNRIIEGRTLVVLLHAYVSTPKDMEPVRACVQRLIPRAEFIDPDMKLSLFSCVNPNATASVIAEQIEAKWRDSIDKDEPYERIILIGHSAGALIARKIYLIACGQDERAPFEPEINRTGGYDWAAKVSRIVLLAAMNRGWRVNHHLNFWLAVIWGIGSTIGKIIEVATRYRLFIFRIRRGADFIANLRVQWLYMSRRAMNSGVPGNAMTVQLLGSIDDMVSPEDNVDLVSGEHFLYLDVPYSGHANVVRLNDSSPAGNGTAGEYRRAFLELALTGTHEEIKRAGVIPADQEIRPHDERVTDVVFVLHGIRDEGYWTHKLARAIRKYGKPLERRFATETSSYGYFPMLPFLFARKRREKVEWFMDQYAEVVASYPNARFHFVGHSNGTYCLARALEQYPCCRFHNVVFAGSVVSSYYDWTRFLESRAPEQERIFGKVERVLNYVADKDWVVAWFPKLFQSILPIQDLGSAGHDGFAGADQDHIRNVKYVKGDHDAAIVESNWLSIAEFIVTGAVQPAAPPEISSKNPNWFVKAVGKFPLVVWLAIAALLIGGGWAVAWGLFYICLPVWGVTLGVVLYALLVWKVLTQF